MKVRHWRDAGYFQRLILYVELCGKFLAATLGGSVLICLYILGTFVLWFHGMYKIFEWSNEMHRSIYKISDRLDPVPGQEHGDTWQKACKLARLKNHGAHDQAHFNVVPFLKSSKGIDVQHLVRLTKSRDAKSQSDQELVGVDRQLPETHIALRHLLQRVEQGAEKRVGPNIAAMR